ncbi:Cytochrome c oxidase subunit NDUFA4 [Platysternon megacephalum]|uniref:Cytochrome c oxidase subunit NDUFA4 n=2 Tax=Testudinoidea TaxID=8486 RepID=A0A4D9EU64_9SAUR|nr:Cytochrome c oxidase subunit NDUFA4 [Platysternon megacephalum]
MWVVITGTCNAGSLNDIGPYSGLERRRDFPERPSSGLPERETPHPTVTMFRLMFNQAKKHPSLIPLFIFIGAGGSGAALYIMRLAMFNPDVCWDKKNNPEPWNKLAPTDQYKFYSVNVDYSKLKKDRPDF